MDSKGVSCVCSRIGDGRGERHVVANLVIAICHGGSYKVDHISDKSILDTVF